MNRPFSPTSLAWLALVVASTVLLTWIDARRISEIERVSQLVPGAPTDDNSPTGYARGSRNLILPEKTPSGQPWIMDVQREAARDAKPMRHATYDNAPEGRAVHGASPYRWWLRLIAGIEGLIGNYSSGRAIERAALHANPILHGLLCLGAGLFAAWRFGAAAGGLLAFGIAGLFPLTMAFSPGQPDDHALLLATNLAGILLLLTGSQTTERGAARLWFTFAGFAAGFGLWLDASSQATVLGAAWMGGLLVALFGGKGTLGDGLSGWRWWAVGGAAMATAGWIVEGRPGGLTGSDLDTNHPVLALAWMAGIGALATLATGWCRKIGFRRAPRFRSGLCAWPGMAVTSGRQR
jgi:hypothetical protein